ncbi:MAG: hypothetical protein ACREMK_09605 [Gemmatimonadota bacterium]
MNDPTEIVDRHLPDLLPLLARIPGLAVRPFLATLLTAAVSAGVRSLAEYVERVRSAPIVPFAIPHRPTRRELAAYVRGRPGLDHLESALDAAERDTGSERSRRWEALRLAVGRAQAELARPLAGQRGAVLEIDGFLEILVESGVTDLPTGERRALLRRIADKLEDAFSRESLAVDAGW